MSEESKVTQAEANSETNPSTQAGEKNDVPYSRFQETISEKNSYKSKLEEATNVIAKMEKQNEDARQTSLKKNQEFETLYNETNSQLEKLKADNASLSTDVNTFREGLVNQLPEESQQFTKGMDMKTLQEFVAKETKVVNSTAGKINQSRQGVTPNGKFGGYENPQEWAIKDPKGFSKHLEDNVEGYIK